MLDSIYQVVKEKNSDVPFLKWNRQDVLFPPIMYTTYYYLIKEPPSVHDIFSIPDAQHHVIIGVILSLGLTQNICVTLSVLLIIMHGTYTKNRTFKA